MNPFRVPRPVFPVLFGLGLILAGTVQAAGEEDLAWNTRLKQQFYGDRPIEEGTQVVELTAPYRAEDPALVPLQITSKIPQAQDHYIKNITLVIDNNPVPFSASFDFTPESGKADVALRARVNAYTNVRAIAETNDGKLYMNKAFVKASGGCSAPIGTDLEAAMARLGKMKFKFDGDKAALGQANPVQLLISHPNISGMQMDQISRLVKPAHFVDEVKVSFDGKPVLTAKTDIAVSADPNFRFYFVPDKAGELKAEIKDNLGNHFTQTQAVTP
ncbi:quinoprotein dehydrogenase-associated SoxYZ-like carrier [Methylomagnum ishizawai]|uniref:quinoprotein dehydrogenase-associated SoxYZ-like carrier n=1 Tax=Methylomagnum ishizawai TaxID=1760988 RepID=UPI001C31F84E|nr:quinoprotein dehydrogenase-associated SoxYZ-like carrier [Methylomagnum ishizawai]BBL73935.1 quinoprotein dehydrogenase-associated SoxYZ-like carrier [Methylomagnum ishizawai]